MLFRSTGDAYVDHPSFGTAIISRVIEAEGFRVGIIAQPNWKTDADFKRFGRPKYAFMINSGNIDSMVAHYTAAKKKRSDDAYSAGNKAGKRPDRALTVYCKRVREIYPDVPIIVGGLEASLRRFANYDYWAACSAACSTWSRPSWAPLGSVTTPKTTSPSCSRAMVHHLV